MTLPDLQAKLADFADQRSWTQFHTPKNLVMALSGEVGELTEIFQWLTDDQARDLVHDPQAKANVAQELADVFAYLLRLADVLNVDLPTALENKITVNQERYPVDKAHGHARKYDSLDRQL